jgi:uncharacterized cupin superfamily protein
MPKIEIDKIAVERRAFYPEPFARLVRGREYRRLGDAVGLTQFGANLTRLAPGAAASARHWHEAEDEFVYVLEGELILAEDEGETLMRAGDAAGFKAGVANGHHLVNRSNRDGVFLVIGTRAPRERGHYPDVDLAYHQEGEEFWFARKNGERY